MTCPRCYAEFETGKFEPGRAGICPECGAGLVRNVSGVMKTSAVMIAAGEEKGFYRSLQEVPEPLRTRLIEITNGANAGTIVIADRAGKEQMTQVMARREKAAQRTSPVAPRRELRILGVSWVVWAGILLLMVAAGIIAATFTIHW